MLHNSTRRLVALLSEATTPRGPRQYTVASFEGFGATMLCRDHLTRAQAAVPDFPPFTPVILLQTKLASLRCVMWLGAGAPSISCFNPKLDLQCM